MARTQAILPGKVRLLDYMNVGVIARVLPMRAVEAAPKE